MGSGPIHKCENSENTVEPITNKSKKGGGDCSPRATAKHSQLQEPRRSRRFTGVVETLAKYCLISSLVSDREVKFRAEYLAAISIDDGHGGELSSIFPLSYISLFRNFPTHVHFGGPVSN